MSIKLTVSLCNYYSRCTRIYIHHGIIILYLTLLSFFTFIPKGKVNELDLPIYMPLPWLKIAQQNKTVLYSSEKIKLACLG